MQTNAFITLTTARTVFNIAFDRVAYGGQLGPDLMMPSRVKVYFKQCISVATIQYFVGEFSLLRTGLRAPISNGFIVFWILLQEMVKLAVFSDLTVYQCPL
jgi:hypothetical protein